MENTASNPWSVGTQRGGQRGEVFKLPDEAGTWMHLFSSPVVAAGQLK